MKLFLLIICFLFFISSIKSQTVIEVTHPENADLILLLVNDPFEADIRIYKTDDILEASEWDCMWKFKKWGFSNFGIFFIIDENDPILINEETGKKYKINAKVYFVENIDSRGYSKMTLGIDGLMRIHRN